jgi:hypothetical protein
LLHVPSSTVSYTFRMTDVPPRFSRVAWVMALLGLGISTFAVVALSGPGRIDNVGAQTRFEVGRSLVEHGDSILRDDRIWWGAYPGAEGKLYSHDRLPPCLVAAACIWIADTTGPSGEERRQFFYTLNGAVACGLLSILYAVWFRSTGCRPVSAILWGAGGIFCTPAWYYGTSTFEESIGTTVLVSALLAAAFGRGGPGGAIVTGLLLGLAYNCVPALGFFLPLALAIQDESTAPRPQRFSRAAMVVAGLLAGVLGEMAYDRFKFPFDRNAVHDQIRTLLYGSDFANNQLAAAAVLSISFGAGAIWYWPPVLLCARGLATNQNDRKILIALILGAAGFFVYCCCRADFVGEIGGACWGPRLLTPMLGVLWLYAPAGASKLRRSLVALLLVLGLCVQILGLCVDPIRLYVERDFSPSVVTEQPWVYFDSSLSHLLNRPQEIGEVVQTAPPEQEFSPSPAPTSAFPLLEMPDLEKELPRELERTRFRQRIEKRGTDVVRQYRVLSSLRPWWVSMTALPRDERPVNLGKFAAIMLAALGGGMALLGMTVRRFRCES